MTVAVMLPTYEWPPSSEAIAARLGLDPLQVVRFDGNTPASPPASARAATIARALAEVNDYDRGRNAALRTAIAGRHGVSPENVVLASGSDDLIVLAARTFAGGGTIATVPARTYSMYGFAAGMAGATLVDDPAHADLTFVCRPNNPTGELVEIPETAGMLVVDEAYAEYAGVSVAGRIDDGLVVLRTFSKAFGLAGARVGYAITSAANARALAARQSPLPVSALSAALAAAALADPPDVAAQVEERERLAAELRRLGLEPLPSWTNFVFVPTPDAAGIAAALLQRGLLVRRFDDGLRISVRDRDDDDLLLAALAEVLEREPAVRAEPFSARHLRATGETVIRVRLRLRGDGRAHVATGCGLYDHMLELLGFHSGMDLVLEGTGDLHTGDHHTVEDAARALGEALDRALGSRRGIVRYGDARVPMDEAVAHAVVDVSGRPVTRVRIDPDPGLAVHAVESLAQAARMTIHLSADGTDAHHTAEAAFKALGRALGQALRPAAGGVPSSKGVL